METKEIIEIVEEERKKHYEWGYSDGYSAAIFSMYDKLRLNIKGGKKRK